MDPFLVLALAFVMFLLAGELGLLWFQDWIHALRAAMACMLLVTAAAHRGKRRPYLIAAVPRALPNPALIVTIIGVLELACAVGLIFETTHRAAGFLLAVLFIVLFPANIRATLQHLTIRGRPMLGLIARGLIQAVFIGAALLCTI